MIEIDKVTARRWVARPLSSDRRAWVVQTDRPDGEHEIICTLNMADREKAEEAAHLLAAAKSMRDVLQQILNLLNAGESVRPGSELESAALLAIARSQGRAP